MFDTLVDAVTVQGAEIPCYDVIVYFLSREMWISVVNTVTQEQAANLFSHKSATANKLLEWHWLPQHNQRLRIPNSSEVETMEKQCQSDTFTHDRRMMWCDEWADGVWDGGTIFCPLCKMCNDPRSPTVKLIKMMMIIIIINFYGGGGEHGLT